MLESCQSLKTIKPLVRYLALLESERLEFCEYPYALQSAIGHASAIKIQYLKTTKNAQQTRVIIIKPTSRDGELLGFLKPLFTDQ